MTIKTVCTFSLVLLLVACSEQTVVASPPIQEATSEIISTPNPQSASIPTITHSLKPTLSPSMIMTVEASMTQTAQQRLIDCDGFPGRNWQIPITTLNDSWRIEFCVSGATSLPYTRLIKNDGSTTWDVPFYETYGVTQKYEARPNGITDGGMVVEHWSYDGKYVYLRPVWCCIDGPGMSFHNIFALYRLDLITGNLDGIIPPGGYSIAFSPNEKYLAFSNGNSLHLLDVNGEKDKVISLDTKYVGVDNFAWSKDGEQLVFVGALEGWDENLWNPNPDNNGFSLLLLDLRNTIVKTLITNDNRRFIPSTDTWLSDNKLYLEDFTGSLYIFDILSHELILLPSTQTPNP